MSGRLVDSGELEVEKDSHIVHRLLVLSIGLLDSFGDVLLLLILFGNEGVQIERFPHLLRHACDLLFLVRGWPIVYTSASDRCGLRPILCAEVQIRVLLP